MKRHAGTIDYEFPTYGGVNEVAIILKEGSQLKT